MTNDKLKEIGKRIQRRRRELALSQEALAEMTDIVPSHLSNIETGKANFGITIFIRIVEALQVPADWLICAETPATKIIVSDEIAKLLDGYSAEEVHELFDMLTNVKHILQKNDSQ